MNLSTFFGSYIAAFLLSWRIALVALPFLLVLLIPGLVYGRTLMSVAMKIRLEYKKAGAIAEQVVSSIRAVYSFVGESKTMTQFSAALQVSVQLGLRQGLAKGLAMGSNSITFAIWAFMSWYGSRLVMYYSAQGGTIFAGGATILVGGFFWVGACKRAVLVGCNLRRAEDIGGDQTSACDRLFQHGWASAGTSGRGGGVSRRGVCLPSRPDNMVFKGFSVRVPAGQMVALVGGSGSGKSTDIALLERFYNPVVGEIIVDGVDVRRLQLKWLRSLMGLVSQEPALFATTIKENILFGKEDATMEEVEPAAKVANAHNFIIQLPQG